MTADGVIAYIRQLFKPHENLGTNQDERNRKRRLEIQEAEAPHPNFAKYRRVSNKFPKQYPVRAYEQDDYYLIRSNNNFRSSFPSSIQNNSRFNMTDRFNNKKTVKDINPYSEVEFSDEEDDHGFTPSRFPAHTVFPSSSVQPSTSRRSNTQMSQSSQMPGLYPIPTSSASVLLTNSIRQAEINRANQRSYSSNSFGLPVMMQQETTKRKSTLFNKIKKPFANAWNPKPTFNSVINSNVNMDSKREYQNLLDRLVPGIFSNRKSRHESIPPLKPLQQSQIPVVDLLDDDSDEPQETGVLSFQRNINRRRTSDVIFKAPNVVLELSDDEDDKNFNRRSSIPSNRRQSLLSSTLIDLESKRKSGSETNLQTSTAKSPPMPRVQPVNSLLEKLQCRASYHHDVINQITKRYEEVRNKRSEDILSEKQNVSNYHQQRRENEHEITSKLRDFTIAAETIVLDEEEPEEEINEFPDFTPEQLSSIKAALSGPPHVVVINKFNMQIARKDLFTLVGENWLNDEIINFYMNLLMERSELNKSLPKVYAMNTFFIPKLIQSGHLGLKRWTRKVDIFSYDVIPVPVHVGQVHWCMAIINMREKAIKYYDSMGHANPRVVECLEQYLKDESLDKRKIPFDNNGWKKEWIKDCPRQMNGSDCGVFSCMFAEFTARGSPITFSQQHMQHFRNKMILEISTGKMLL